MIHRNAIIEWGNTARWREPSYNELDMVISRALISIYQDDYLNSRLAFRGGTAIHKLFMNPPSRFSEDIDFVQITAEPIGQILDRIRKILAFLGEPKTKQKTSNNILLYRFEAEEPKGAISHR
jgi:predicted nucleotidyltransferase component of viral defense system